MARGSPGSTLNLNIPNMIGYARDEIFSNRGSENRAREDRLNALKEKETADQIAQAKMARGQAALGDLIHQGFTAGWKSPQVQNILKTYGSEFGVTGVQQNPDQSVSLLGPSGQNGTPQYWAPDGKHVPITAGQPGDFEYPGESPSQAPARFDLETQKTISRQMAGKPQEYDVGKDYEYGGDPRLRQKGPAAPPDWHLQVARLRQTAMEKNQAWKEYETSRKNAYDLRVGGHGNPDLYNEDMSQGALAYDAILSKTGRAPKSGAEIEAYLAKNRNAAQPAGNSAAAAGKALLGGTAPGTAKAAPATTAQPGLSRKQRDIAAATQEIADLQQQIDDAANTKKFRPLGGFLQRGPGDLPALHQQLAVAKRKLEETAIRGDYARGGVVQKRKGIGLGLHLARR